MLFYALEMVSMGSVRPPSNIPNSSINNSVLFLLGNLLLIINAPLSVSGCVCWIRVPFKLMNFLQQFANVNQLMTQRSPCKKKMSFRIDQRVKMSFPKPHC